VKELLFVYGSLKRSGKNHLLLRDSRFLGEQSTVSEYMLGQVGEFPAMVQVKLNGQSISGEVFLVNDTLLAELDIFEEVPIVYHRKMVRLQDGTTAWAYFKAD